MRTLVTAASKHGSTAGIADAIGSVLTSYGYDVSILDPEAVESIDGFSGVVIGSAVYAGHWLKPAIELTERFANGWAAVPVWIFSSGPIGDPPKPTEDPVDVADVLRVTGARNHRLFAGNLDRARLSFPERAIVGALRATYGDYRDWDEIRGWAKEIAEALQIVNEPAV
jgi:menaquinone-dependent protoporphyrinogen oxidase